MRQPVRRSDRELPPAEAARVLEQGEFGVLSTCGEDGVPYGVPLSYVYDGATIAFHSATAGHKIRNIRRNALACFTVVGRTERLPGKFSTRYESAIAFGQLAEVQGERKAALLRALVQKYDAAHLQKGEAYLRHDADHTAVFELRILRLSGKAHR